MSMSAYDCAVMYKELQHYMRTKTRLGIPLLTSAEGIQGIIQNNCTLFLMLWRREALSILN